MIDSIHLGHFLIQNLKTGDVIEFDLIFWLCDDIIMFLPSFLSTQTSFRIDSVLARPSVEVHKNKNALQQRTEKNKSLSVLKHHVRHCDNIASANVV